MSAPAFDPSAYVHKAAQRLRGRLETLEKSDVSGDGAQREVNAAIEACLERLNGLGLWGEDNRLLSSILWNTAAGLLARGWLQNRARTKPRGYAGDYELLAWIYEQRTAEDSLGELFDRYFQNQAAPQAVRNRMAMMTQWIVDAASGTATSTADGTKVGFVGSALGYEIRDACLRLEVQHRQRLRVVLVDMDPEAVAFAADKLRDVLPAENVLTVAGNFFRLPQRPASFPELSSCDLVFCPGLFDYLDDGAAADMLRALYGRLAPGGRLIAFQFAPHNPTRAYMEWFGNWYLTYRDQQQFRQTVELADLPAASLQFGAEPLGIDLFAAISRPFGSG